MKQFIYIFIVLILYGCANNARKEMDIESSEAPIYVEEEVAITAEDAYTILIKQKLQEQIDQTLLTKKHPGFEIDKHENLNFITDQKTVEHVELVSVISTLSDSVKTVKTKVVFDTKTDTLLTFIRTSTVQIDGEQLKTTTLQFTPIKKKQSKVIDSSPTPEHVEQFSLKDLNFTWEEINGCDCLFMIPAKNTPYKKLYFGRFKDNKHSILQLGKRGKKHDIPIAVSRSKDRKPGSSWKETYRNKDYEIKLKASPTKNKVKGKHTYYINLIFTEITSSMVVKETVLANCKS